MRPAYVTTIVAVVLGALAGAASAHPGAPTLHAAWIAHIVTPTPEWSAPAHGRTRTTISPIAGDADAPVALLVLGARRLHNATTWLRVLLPQRPNGSSVWIDADLVRLTRTPWRIEVSLEQRTVSLLRAGRVTDRWPAVVGKPSTPTPTGLFSVYQRVRQPNPNAFLGTWALLLSGFSNALREFDGGARTVCDPRARRHKPARPARNRTIARLHPDRQQRHRPARSRRRRRNPRPDHLI